MLIFSRFVSKNAGYYSHFFVIIDREAERGEAAEAERGETAGAERGKTLPCPTALTITSGPALQKPGCGFILPVEPDIRPARMTALGVHPPRNM